MNNTKDETHSTLLFASSEETISFLEKAKVEGSDTFLEALAMITKNKGMSHISQQTGLNRENLYRSLKAGAQPRYDTIEKVLAGLGITIQFSSSTCTSRSKQE